MTHIDRNTVTRALTLAALTLPLTAQTTLQGLGTSIANLSVEDVSADGTAVVARASSQGYLWTTSNPTWTLIPGSAGGSGFDVANGGTYVSATLVNPSNNLQSPALWSASTGLWTFLPGLGSTSGNSLGSAYDLSADGSVLVGLGWLTASRAHAFRWDAVNGTTDLGSMNGTLSSSRPNGVSADGTTAVGWDEDQFTGVWRSARWNGMVESLMGCLDPADPINGPSQAWVASANGQYVAGESSTGLFTPSGWNENHTFRWDAVNGMLDLGTTPVDPFGWGNHASVPTGISNDGRTVVGYAGINAFGPGVVRPMFIWREGNGMFLIKDYLVALGVPQAAAWTYNSIAGMSVDGRVIVGSGRNPSNVSEPYMIVLAPQGENYCTAKINSQGCTPAMTASGIASMTSSLPFVLGASNVINTQSGTLYYGVAPLSSPFQGGIKCVANPSVRTPLQNSGGSTVGTDCTGTYAIDFNAWIQGGLDPSLAAGTQLYSQYWSRDPASASTTNLTDAIRFGIFP